MSFLILYLPLYFLLHPNFHTTLSSLSFTHHFILFFSPRHYIYIFHFSYLIFHSLLPCLISALTHSLLHRYSLITFLFLFTLNSHMASLFIFHFYFLVSILCPLSAFVHRLHRYSVSHLNSLIQFKYNFPFIVFIFHPMSSVCPCTFSFILPPLSSLSLFHSVTCSSYLIFHFSSLFSISCPLSALVYILLHLSSLTPHRLPFIHAYIIPFSLIHSTVHGPRCDVFQFTAYVKGTKNLDVRHAITGKRSACEVTFSSLGTGW